MKIKQFKCAFCGSKIVRKDDGRVHFCNNVCKSEKQKEAKPVTKDWLYEHYITKRMDTTQIARIVKRHPKGVWGWLKSFGIPTRPRGGFTAPGSFKKGQPNLFQGMNHSEETKSKLKAIEIADGRVPYDPKVGSYMKGRRGELHPNWKGGITADRQVVYASAEWKKAVRLVWKRDEAKCQRCGMAKKENKQVPFDIHHIESFENKNLRCEATNLVLFCEPCHYWVHSKKNKTKLWIK